MRAQLLSVKFLILYTFISSALYIHFRGKVKFSFQRQLTDFSTFLAPINVFIYLFSAIPNKRFIKNDGFPELKIIEDNWEIIRDEARLLIEQKDIKISNDHDDTGFNTFFKRGWKRFYIKWYKGKIPSAERLCPKTSKLINSIPSIKGAMFALLPKGAQLGKHRDPYAGSLRYHLGLITPNSDDCFISVDGEKYSWRDGESVIFDETYIHYAMNQTDQDRLILFCDVARPMRYGFATLIRDFLNKTLLVASAAKNADGDYVGLMNRVFKYVHRVGAFLKNLKSKNRKLYYLYKYAVFISLFYLLFFRNLNF